MKSRASSFTVGFVLGLLIVLTLVLELFWAAFSGDSRLERRQKVARIANLIHPGYSTCGRCDMPWAVTEGHSTQYSDSWGMFPLCVECWTELRTPEARLPFYRAVYERWEKDGERDDGYHNWKLIEAAVMAGK